MFWSNGPDILLKLLSSLYEVKNDSRKKRQGLPLEFEKEAFALVRTQGYSIAKAAQLVNLSEWSLCHWKEISQVSA